MNALDDELPNKQSQPTALRTAAEFCIVQPAWATRFLAVGQSDKLTLPTDPLSL
jgi:hypothetical protein